MCVCTCVRVCMGYACCGGHDSIGGGCFVVAAAAIMASPFSKSISACSMRAHILLGTFLSFKAPGSLLGSSSNHT